jgi:hypothetical protein
MRPACAASAEQDSPNAFISDLPGSEGFFISRIFTPALVSQQKPVRWNLFNGQP